MREKWGADAAVAWLPLCSAANPVLKILRKGAPNFPASVRYISAQMERACNGGTGLSSELLRAFLLNLLSDLSSSDLLAMGMEAPDNSIRIARARALSPCALVRFGSSQLCTVRVGPSMYRWLQIGP